MKTLSSRGQHYVVAVSTLLIAVALTGGMVSCGGGGGKCSLTVSSTTGGTVTTPGEGTFDYTPKTEVDLVAEAEEGYHFVNWAGDVSTVTDVNTAVTTISMYDDYEITGNFEEDNVMVAAGTYHTVLLKSGGTVVVMGNNLSGQCSVDNWTDIVQVTAGSGHTVGLNADGTVVAVGYNGDDQCNVGDW